MVQVIENRADIEGRVTAIRPADDRPEHTLVTIDVARTLSVEGYPNLFSNTAGKALDVLVPVGEAERLVIGSAVRCRIRLGGPNTVFAVACAAQ